MQSHEPHGDSPRPADGVEHRAPAFVMRLFGIAAAINAPWELVQMRLYTGREPFSLGHIVTCFAMSLADGATIVLVVFLADFLSRRLGGAWRFNAAHYAVVSVLGGVAATFGEYLGLRLGWWSYRHSMPMVFGLGLVPIAQLTLLSPAALFIAVSARLRNARLHRSA